MKQLFFLAFLFIVISGAVQAQSYEGTTRYDKKTQKAVVIDYAYPAEAVENALIQIMANLGYKPREEKGLLNRDKGFLVFKNAYVTDISDERMDYIINVERKSRKESDESTLYVIMSKSGDNALEKMSAEDIGKAKVFLNTMLPEIEAAHLELQIKDQEEKITKAEKKLSDLKTDHASLLKKLEENTRDQENTQRDIESQRKALEVLTGRRKVDD